MSDEIVKVTTQGAVVERLDSSEAVEVGHWYWVAEPEGSRWLGCVTHLGSNYAKLRGIQYHDRVHLDGFHDRCARELDAKGIIEAEVGQHRLEVDRLMGRVRDVTAALAMGASGAALQSGCETTALALSDGGKSAKEYETALAVAKDQTLPDLFKRIKEENELMAQLLTAELIPLQAQAKQLEPTVKMIEAQIFNVELYAGLVEQVVQVADGPAAAMHEPVRLFQRRHYMDEECLAQYQTGGMDFESIGDFDRWVAAPENRDRILPFSRCIVAFRIRRNSKDFDTGCLSGFIRMMHRNMGGDPDKLTFLYVRNGEKMFRLSTAIDFGERLYPDVDFTPPADGQSYAIMQSGRVERVVSQAERDDALQRRAEAQERENEEYEREVAEYPAKLAEWERLHAPWAEEKAKYEAAQERLDDWNGRRKTAVNDYFRTSGESVLDGDPPGFTEEAPEVPSFTHGREPMRPMEPHKYKSWHHTFDDGYEPFNRSSVYYDDISAHMAREMAEHNRLVLVLQGLLDRSPALHPHPPWQLWTEAGFREALTLVYDDSRALTPGAAPDIEAYLAELSASLGPGSVTIGQEAAWLRREGRRENEAQQRRGHDRDRDLEFFQPYGDPGPGRLAVATHVRGGKHTFEWESNASRMTYGEARKSPEDGKFYRYLEYRKVKRRIVVPARLLFNVSAYKPGDFKRFFADPRTRADYLRWAPLLLTAEEYHAGKLKLGDKSRGDAHYYEVSRLLRAARGIDEGGGED